MGLSKFVKLVSLGGFSEPVELLESIKQVIIPISPLSSSLPPLSIYPLK